MNLPSSFDETGAQFAWDSTTLKAAFTCQRMYYYEFVEFWQANTISTDLIFGGHYAAALESYHKLRALGSPHDEALLSVVTSTMIETWVHSRTKDGARIPGTGHAQEFFHTSKTRENLIRTIVWYLEEVDETGFATLIKSDGTPAVEMSFKLELDNGIIYAGHLDRVVSNGQLAFVQDQKTTGSTVSPSYFSKYDLDIQMSGYTFAGRAVLATPIRGVMIDAAQVAVGFSRFMRGFTYRNEATLGEWYQTSMDKILSVREATKRFHDTGDLRWFAQNYTACTMYRGCSFAGICSAAPSLREKYLLSNFTRREHWNPLVER